MDVLQRTCDAVEFLLKEAHQLAGQYESAHFRERPAAHCLEPIKVRNGGSERFLYCINAKVKLTSLIPMKTVLIVDDHQDTCDVLKLTLESAGYTVLTATNGLAAIALARRHRPAFILLDYILEGALGSSNVVDTLKADGILSHVVLMTGIGDPKQKAIQLGVKYALQKPFAPDALYALLDKVKSS
jgi:CheY-like chemotaxis protein